VRVDFGHADAGAERCGFHEDGIRKFFFDLMNDYVFVVFPFVAANGDPGNDGDFGGAEKFFGDVFIHGDGGAEDAGADEGKTGEVEETLDGAVFAEGAVHDGEDDVDALAGAAAVEADESGVGGIGAHGDALAGAENLRKHFLGAGADEPVAFFGDADGHDFVFVRVEAANHGGCGGEGDFVFAGAAAEENADAQSFFVRGHGKCRFGGLGANS